MNQLILDAVKQALPWLIITGGVWLRQEGHRCLP